MPELFLMSGCAGTQAAGDMSWIVVPVLFHPTAHFAKFDMIIGMDDQNIEALKRAAINEEERAKIFKMTDFCRKSTSYSEIPDPYYEGPQGFELVLDLLEDAVAGLYRYCLAHY